MPDVHDETAADELEPGAYRWVVRGLYTVLIAANLWLALDWWRSTEGGAATLERWRGRLEAAKTKAQECEGCARRRALLHGGFEKAKNRMHWQAERIVEGEDVPTQPEAPA